jgi:hypothetical protein
VTLTPRPEFIAAQSGIMHGGAELRDRILDKVEAAAAPSTRHSGRGSTGRLRNFNAMNDVKLLAVRDTIVAEANDSEALDACESVIEQRGL